MKAGFLVIFLMIISAFFFIQIPICEKGEFFYKNLETGECSLFYSTCDKKDNFIDCSITEKIKTVKDMYCKSGCDFSIVNNKNEIIAGNRIIFETANLENIINSYSAVSFLLKLEDYKITKPADYSISSKEDDMAEQKSTEYKASLFSESFYTELSKRADGLKNENKEFYLSLNGEENELVSNFDFGRFQADGIILSCTSVSCTNISLFPKIIRIPKNLKTEALFDVFYSALKNNCRVFQFENETIREELL